MLLQLYPRVHRRYSSLPVFGPIVEDFGTWLLKQGYSTDCIREHFCCMRRIARLLHRQGRKERICPLWPQTAEMLREFLAELGPDKTDDPPWGR